MSTIFLTLGDVTFQDFEVPEKISFGGWQRAAVHELIGGGRVVDVLGGQPAEIIFGGIFTGADAVMRAQSLDTACGAGDVLELGWDAFFYNVVIAKFAADYNKPFWIPFHIACFAVSDIALAAAALAIPVGGLISSDLGMASQWAGAAGIGVQNFSVANAVPGRQACAVAVSEAGRNLVGNLSIIDNQATPLAAVAALAGLYENNTTLAAASYAGGYLARAARNIGMGAL